MSGEATCSVWLSRKIEITITVLWCQVIISVLKQQMECIAWYRYIE